MRVVVLQGKEKIRISTNTGIGRQMVNFNEISVVISGPIIKLSYGEKNEINATMKACESVRKEMPGAEIVLSTWEAENVDGIDYDLLVKSSDIGGAEKKDGENTNRQICSRRAGIKAATKKYVLAMRSESHILNLNFLNYWDKYNKYSDDTEWKFLKKRVIVPAIMPAHRALLFHMGDWYYFGLKEDVLDLWDLPYWKKGTRNNNADDLMYNPHRYVFTEFVRKHHTLIFDKNTDNSKENRLICEKVIANNFVVTGFQEFGLDSYKYYYPKTREWRRKQIEVNYTHGEWVKLYNKYCNGAEIPEFTIEQRWLIWIYVPYKKIKANLRNLVKRIVSFFRKGSGK